MAKHLVRDYEAEAEAWVEEDRRYWKSVARNGAIDFIPWVDITCYKTIEEEE